MDATSVVAISDLLDWIVDFSDWKRYLTHAHDIVRLVNGAWRELGCLKRVFIPTRGLSIATRLPQSLILENWSDGVLWSSVRVEDQRLTSTILLWFLFISLKTDPINENGRLLIIDWETVLESHLFVTVLIPYTLSLLSLLLEDCHFGILNPETWFSQLRFLLEISTTKEFILKGLAKIWCLSDRILRWAFLKRLSLDRF